MKFSKPNVFICFKSAVVLFVSQGKTNKINQLKHSIVICNKIEAFFVHVLEKRGWDKPNLFHVNIISL